MLRGTLEDSYMSKRKRFHDLVRQCRIHCVLLWSMSTSPCLGLDRVIIWPVILYCPGLEDLVVKGVDVIYRLLPGLFDSLTLSVGPVNSEPELSIMKSTASTFDIATSPATCGVWRRSKNWQYTFKPLTTGPLSRLCRRTWGPWLALLSTWDVPMKR